MRNLLRLSVTLSAAALLVLSGTQASWDASYITTSNMLEQQRQVQEVRSYVQDVRELAERARSIQNGVRTGYHQGG